MARAQRCHMLLDLLLTTILVLANGLFVTSEFTLARLRPTQVDQLERERRPGSRSVRHAMEHLDAYLATCQLGIMTASLGLGVAGEPAFRGLLAPLLGADAEIAGVALGATLAFALARGARRRDRRRVRSPRVHR